MRGALDEGRAGGGPALTTGLVLGVTVMALGGLAVVTIAPRLPAELGGLELYGWLFSGNLVAALVGTVWGGIAADHRGPARPFVLGLAAFALGSGLAALAPTMLLAVLAPARTLQLGPGLGAVVAGRGLFFAAFITVEVFLALMLTDVHGLSSAVTGLVIAAGALSWSVGAWAQARLDARASLHPEDEGGLAPLAPGPVGRLALRRDLRVRVGVAVLGVGLLAQGASLALHGGPVVAHVPVALLVALLGWSVAGAGIGFAHATSSALALARAEREGVAARRISLPAAAAPRSSAPT